MEIPEGFKKTEVGAIPIDWKFKPLKVVSSMSGRIGWQGLKQEEFTFNSRDPYLITGMNFKDGKIRWEEVYHIPEKRYQEAKNIQLKKDDILMTKDGTIGKLLYVEDIPFPSKASLNSHLLVFRPLNYSYYPKFLFYQLSSKQFLDYVDLNKSGSTFFGITQEAIGNYKAYLPPLPEQRTIALSLSDTDALIAACDRAITKKRNIKQGAMQQLLTGKMRLPGFSGEWEYMLLGFLSAFITKGTTPTTYGFKWEKEGVLFLRSECVSEFGLDLTQSMFIAPEAHNVLKRGEVRAGDILITITGNVGRVIHLDKSVAIANINQHIARIRITDINVVAEYVFHFLSQSSVRKYYNLITTGQAYPQISLKQVREMKIPLPPLPEQKAIAQILSDMDAEIAVLEKKRDKYKAIKQGMMQELLTGKTRLIDNS